MHAGPVLPSSYLGAAHPFHRAAPPLFPPGVGHLYGPAAASSFQTLLANISAAQRPKLLPTTAPDYVTPSPPLSPGGGGGSSPGAPDVDRRSSSIAALRLKAREHELKLEMLRQNGHGDLIS